MAETPANNLEHRESGAGSLSRDGAIVQRNVELRWMIHSMRGYDAAEDRAKTLAPGVYFGHRRTGLSVRPVSGGWFAVTAEYANSGIDQYEEGESGSNDDGATIVPHSVSVEFTDGTEHITQAWSDSGDPDAYVTGSAVTGGAPLTYGAINTSGNQVNGVDIPVGAMQFSETWMMPASYLLFGPGGGADPYVKTLMEMNCKVNSDEFRGFPQGSVLFRGARFEASATATMVPVTFRFDVRERRTGVTIGEITDIFKDGWDYLWVEYENEVESQSLIRKPKYSYVARVIERKPFANLKIGTSFANLYLSTHAFTHPLESAGFGVQ
jgi:hypothetical protein